MGGLDENEDGRRRMIEDENEENEDEDGRTGLDRTWES